MARDHPSRVTAMCVLDILPTATLLSRADAAFATAYYHWFFLVQPGGLPERMIGADPEWFLRETVRRWSGDPGAHAEEAMAEYVRCFREPAAIHASCEDYRAAASIDLEHDAIDAASRVEVPVLALWGAHGAMGLMYDVLGAWHEMADDLRGEALDCGHFPAEEVPEETVAALLAFLAGQG